MPPIDSTYLPKASNASFVTLIDIVLVILGSIAVFMVVYSGVQIIISNGDSSKIATARKSILFAILGLIVIISSRLIISFIINRL